MSECVVRMEMPKHCGECELKTWDIWPGSFKCVKTMHDIMSHIRNRTKPNDCPILCQLPEGHGRPGDLDELKNWLVAQIEHYKRFDYGAICSTMVSAYETVCKVIDSMTVIGQTEAERSET